MSPRLRIFLEAMGQVLSKLDVLAAPVKAAARWAEKESSCKHDAISPLGELGYFQVDLRSAAELGYTAAQARSLVRTPGGSAMLSARHLDALLRRAYRVTSDPRTALFLAKLEHGLPILAAAVRRRGRVSSPSEAVQHVVEADRNGGFRLNARDWSGAYPRFVGSAYYVIDGADHGFTARRAPMRLTFNRCGCRGCARGATSG